jgi:hypothetical protein
LASSSTEALGQSFGSFSPRGARSKCDQQPDGRVAHNQKLQNILGVDIGIHATRALRARKTRKLEEEEEEEAAAAAAKNSKWPVQFITPPMLSDWAPDALAYTEDWARSGSTFTEDFDPFSSAQLFQIPKENNSNTIPAMPTLVEEAEQGRLSDIDMDRITAISLTSLTFATYQKGGVSYVKELSG